MAVTPSGSPEAARCQTPKGSQRLELRQGVGSGDPEGVAGKTTAPFGLMTRRTAGSQPVARPAQQAFDPEGVAAGVAPILESEGYRLDIRTV